MPGGTLYVVATPLGHLGDLSERAGTLLRAVPVVTAEDTRRSRALLTHLGAHPRVIAYHAHSRASATASVLAALREGNDVALVTDAGTPAVSDPGALLVALVRDAGYAVVPLPGPSAVTAALSAAGLPADRYVFFGFLPRKGSERARLLQRIGGEEWTMVLFEAPGRVGDLLNDLVAVCGTERRVVVARELTKLHEEFYTGTLGELATQFGNGESVRGECTVVVEGRGRAAESRNSPELERAARRLLESGLETRRVIELLGELLGVSRNEAYRAVTALRGKR
ncbi:MAG: 16S rRNA (cytidine(1402)-2'-O)-methyltransferase [Gemmatimonadales bacterium]